MEKYEEWYSRGGVCIIPSKADDYKEKKNIHKDNKAYKKSNIRLIKKIRKCQNTHTEIYAMSGNDYLRRLIYKINAENRERDTKPRNIRNYLKSKPSEKRRT